MPLVNYRRFRQARRARPWIGTSGAPPPNPDGTGAIVVPAATVAGTGALVLTGTGAITVPAATVAGTGAEIFTATGAVAVPAATVAGTGEEVFTATGAISVPVATVAGSGFTEAGTVKVPQVVTQAVMRSSIW